MNDDSKEKFQIESLEVKDLWGRQDKRIVFNERVNILIGRNASGKTTLMNILYYVVTADLFRLSEIEFSSATIKLKSFSSRARRTIRVERDDENISVRLGNSPSAKAPLRFASRDDAYFERHFHRTIRDDGRETLDEIRTLVPTAWLPVSRRLSIPDPDDDSSQSSQWRNMPRRWRQNNSSLESVDHRLSELSELLHKYRFQIEQTLSSRYKEFEQRVLEIVLFDEERDKLPMTFPSKEVLGDASK
ncbi:MAG: AAA family ATPase, partial [Boseongicola sp. SB0664_bin_43]|nr:AAA family ATPase [Boseongicola sp. SB0664_bin_43]